MKACAKKLSVLENDKKFGVIWKSLRNNDFKCAHCPAAGISPVYKSNLREHVFRHVFKMHASIYKRLSYSSQYQAIYPLPLKRLRVMLRAYNLFRYSELNQSVQKRPLAKYLLFL
jgi:hypothetical protein